MNDWNMLGRGTLVGHLLECVGQVADGSFADPGVNDVSGLVRLGFPIGEVREDGKPGVTKVAGPGGGVTARTVKEQLLYEIGCRRRRTLNAMSERIEQRKIRVEA